MSDFKVTEIQGGAAARVDQTYFDGTENATMSRTYVAVGSYVHQLLDNGTTSQACVGLLPTGPTLHVGDNLAATLRKTVR